MGRHIDRLRFLDESPMRCTWHSVIRQVFHSLLRLKVNLEAVVIDALASIGLHEAVTFIARTLSICAAYHQVSLWDGEGITTSTHRHAHSGEKLVRNSDVSIESIIPSCEGDVIGMRLGEFARPSPLHAFADVALAHMALAACSDGSVITLFSSA